MAFTLIGPAPLGDFSPINLTLEERGGVRVQATGPDGVYDAYQMPDGRIVGEALRVPSAAKLATMKAINDQLEAERTVEVNRVQQVANILAKLDARTATSNEIQATLAAVIRFVRAESRRG